MSTTSPPLFGSLDTKYKKDGKIFDLKDCKLSEYLSDEQFKLGLSNKIWCGQIGKRFIKKSYSKALIYDSVLDGYWSHRSSVLMNWKNAGKYCRSLGQGWSLPNIYQLTSLVKQKRSSEGFISKAFSDNDNSYIWSATPASGAFFWTLGSRDGVLFRVPAKRNKVAARCFKKK